MRNFFRSEHGNFAVITALAMVPIMTGVAGVVDFVSINNKAGKLQNSLDISALAIGTKYYSGMSGDELTSLGRDFFDSNLARARDEASELIYNHQLTEFDASATTSGDISHIEVISTIEQKGMIGNIDWRTTRRAVVEVAPGQPACVLALDPTASAAVKLQGSTQVVLDGCVIASNFSANDSVSRGGSAQVAAECVTTVGGTEGLTGYNTDLECGIPRVNQYASLDPLMSVVPPSYTACKSVPGGKTKTLSPGTFFNKTISGDVTLDPGVYILRGGQIKLGGNGSLTGSGVTIFLMEGAEFTSNANEVINLSPPSEGPYAGITIYQERTNTDAVVINGGSGSNVTGFIYAPSAHVFYAANSDMSGSGQCIRVVGNTVEMTGNSSVASNCEAELGGKKMYAGRSITLVR
ncbi:putative Flp pilus-assembly TadE/G-like protein [Aminobacter aminovorans]|uniref:Flp pilus assembly protein TadG n=1 Tax=Aminobacter aminovorans TaxID=83263 RepID=A0A381INX9_AMIAI|nr:pilus assembly protein TadG-related protein [Aminobacter aminovorans]TCS21526.1 putative Flp pilus-assembly TadE/G-like protein [Aminobacter aminovorans]SUY29218.1 Flp pilus assembly protein TadG [Aminobacter aminovorans]